MTPQQQLQQSVTAALDAFNSTKAPADPLALLASVHFALGQDQVINATPAPVVPPHPAPPPVPTGKVIRIGPSQPHKSLDDVDLNAAANTVYLLDAGATIRVSKPQTIHVTGVTIQGDGVGATIDSDAKWKKQQYVFTGAGCAIRNLNLMGHDGGEFAGIKNAIGFTVDNISQHEHPVHKGGIGVIATDGSDGLTIKHLITQRTARYSVWLGFSSKCENRNFSITDFDLGPCAIVEDKHSSGMITGANQGGGPSEHCMRIYGARNGKIGSADKQSFCRNPHNADGKQSLKLMSGTDVVVTNVLFDGSTRWGRDQNDPPNYTLKNVKVTGCTFTDWVRIDPGAEVSISDSKASAHSSGNCFSMQGGALKVKNVTASYPGGKFANSMSHVDTSGGGNVFNGKPI